MRTAIAKKGKGRRLFGVVAEKVRVVQVVAKKVKVVEAASRRR